MKRETDIIGLTTTGGHPVRFKNLDEVKINTSPSLHVSSSVLQTELKTASQTKESL